MKLVDITDIHASAYNPRTSDPKRLEYIELSLRKLGFLLPLYADQCGELLSGHQRLYVAERMGVKCVPVEYVKHMNIEERKKWNIVFNRATNDLKRADTSATVTEKLQGADVFALAEKFPDLNVNSDEIYPCLYQKLYDVDKLVRMNIDEMDDYTFRNARSLEKINVELPIVISERGMVVNGIGRLRNAAERNKKTVKVVILPDDKAEFANLMLNYVSMDFDIHMRYADELRYNSFMRTRNTRSSGYSLGNGFYKGVFPNANGSDFPVLEGEVLKKWKAAYGESVVDFGAGKLLNTIILRNSGISVSAFEPYFLAVGEKISKTESAKLTELFLQDVERGKQYDTIFISSVFNSVPFMQDRKYIAVICSALCNCKTKLVCWTQSVKFSSQLERAKGRHFNKVEAMSTTFLLEYEPNIIIGDLSAHPKVQKMHSRSELIDIFSPVFNRLDRIDNIVHNFWYLEASRAKPVDTLALKDALEFEFELPYPDGTRMGLSERAKQAFAKRLGIKF
jgi:hypothetical protein